MLEDVGRFGQSSPGKNQLRLAELVERLVVNRRHGIQQLVGKLPSNDGPNLGDLPHGREAVEPSQQTVVQRCWNRESGWRAAQNVAVGRLLEEPRSEDCLS